MNTKDLELTLLLIWKEEGIEEIYKYKNRIKIFFGNPGRVHIELMYDVTHLLFRELKDIASHKDMEPEEGKLKIDDMITKRTLSAD